MQNNKKNKKKSFYRNEQETFQTRLPLLSDFVTIHQRVPKQSEEFRYVRTCFTTDWSALLYFFSLLPSLSIPISL